MLPAKLARLICLLLLQNGWRCGGHWNDDFRVCRNNVIHEFTTFFSHKQQFNDDDKSCKLEAEKLSSLWWYGGSSLWWNFCQRQFLVGLALQTTTAAPAHHLFETNNESNWLCQVLSSAQFLFALYISTEFRLLFFSDPKVQRYCQGYKQTWMASAELFVIRGSKRKQPYFATCLTLQ